jgi:hypothetical protein
MRLIIIRSAVTDANFLNSFFKLWRLERYYTGQRPSLQASSLPAACFAICVGRDLPGYNRATVDKAARAGHRRNATLYFP